VNIIWDDDKSSKLKPERGISLEEAAVLILQKQYRVEHHNGSNTDLACQSCSRMLSVVKGDNAGMKDFRTDKV
jgi:hypothetical protein